MMNRVIFEPDRWRAAGMVDRESYTKAGAQGLLCVFGDERFGGAGIDDFRFDQIFIEENMRHGDVGCFHLEGSSG
jgi:Acyl-CoA dehydrogenase, N-terminal domain